MRKAIRYRSILFSASLILLVACGGSDDSGMAPPVVIVDEDAGDPVANNDAYEVQEEGELQITNLLSNDTLIDNATMSSIDTESVEGGTIAPGANGSFIYTPALAFAGADSFTYTLCDDDTPTPSCSTATVTITVIDEGSPQAIADAYEVLQNTTTIFDGVLANDSLIDDAFISTLDATSENGGQVILNENGTV